MQTMVTMNWLKIGYWIQLLPFLWMIFYWIELALSWIFSQLILRPFNPCAKKRTTLITDEWVHKRYKLAAYLSTTVAENIDIMNNVKRWSKDNVSPTKNNHHDELMFACRFDLFRWYSPHGTRTRFCLLFTMFACLHAKHRIEEPEDGSPLHHVRDIYELVGWVVKQSRIDL